MFETIQPSKTTLDNIHIQNPQFYNYARNSNQIGQSYTVGQDPAISLPEKHFERDPWEYKINKYGFRGPDWDFKPRIALFGCSFGFGWGVEKDASQVMTEDLNTQVINMGIPGASSIHIIKTFASFAKLHPMSHAFISLPPLHRVFMPHRPDKSYLESDFFWSSKFPAQSSSHRKYMNALYKIWTDDALISTVADYIDWAQLIAKDNKIQLYFTNWADILQQSGPHVDGNIDKMCDNYYSWPKLDTDLARDGGHPGPRVLKDYAHTCLQLL